VNDKAVLLRAYVLEAGGDDARLRAVLAEACPDCAGELVAAEADLATLALALQPVAPPAALRGRVLAQMAAATGAVTEPAPVAEPRSIPTSSNPGGPGVVAPMSSPPSSAPRRRAMPGVVLAAAILLVTAALIGGVGGAWLMTSHQDDRLAVLAEGLNDLRMAQTGAGGQLDDIVERLKRTRSLTEALKEREARLARVESELIDLRSVVAAGGGRDAEVAQLKQQLAVLRSSQLTMFDVVGTERQPGAKARLMWDRDGQRWLLSATGLTAPAAGRCFELWFITTDGRKIGSKTFTVDAQGRGELLVDVPRNIGPIALAAITDEPVGGVAVPTGQIHLAGKVN